MNRPDPYSSMYAGRAPSVISETSERAASRITDPMRATSYRKILEALAAHGAMTRERLAGATGLKESSLCARLFELRPTWITAISAGGKSTAGLAVDTYDLTPAGLDRWRQAGAVKP